MRGRIFRYRRWLYALTLLVLAADAVVYLGWIRNPDLVADANPEQVRLLDQKMESLRAEAARLKRIQDGVPLMGERARKFMAERLLGERAGYRVLAEDLNAAARDAGLALRSLNGSAELEPERPQLLRIEMTSNVEGTFGQLLRFMNNLERTQQLYLLTRLSLVESEGGRIQVRVQTVTYFRREQG